MDQISEKVRNEPRDIIMPFSGVFPLRRMISISRKSIIFPFYHGINNNTPTHIKNLYTQKTVDEFLKDINLLLKYFSPLSPSFLLDRYSMKHLRTPSFIMSFDDGLRECYDIVAPILEEKRVPAIFFLNNSFIDNKDLFYRYKVSLIIEKINNGKTSKRLLKLLTYLIKTDSESPENFSKALLNLEYKNMPLIDEIAGLLKLDFSKYLETHKPYMSSENVKDLISRGFYIGSHTYDHPVIPQLTELDQEREIIKSIEDIKERFNVDYSFFAFPFSDDGVSSELFRTLYTSKLKPDASFGTSGLRKTPDYPHYQRIPMEKSNGNAKRYLQTEYFYYLVKSVMGRNS